MLNLLAQQAPFAPQPLPGPVAEPLTLPQVEYSVLLPELIVIGGALLLLLLSSVLVKRARMTLWTVVTLATCAAAFVPVVQQWHKVTESGGRSEAGRVFAGALVNDGFRLFFAGLILASVVIATLVGDAWLRREGQNRGPEFHVLLLLSAAGGMFLAAANDLIVVFLGIETLSLPLFVLAAFHARRALGREAALKYFVLSAFSSALFLYGVALVYGATGSTNLDEVAGYLAANVTTSGMLLAGVGLLIVGLGFKVAAVPFHSWAPDVYQGAPSPVTGFMAAAGKAAAFAALLRILGSTFSSVRLDTQPLIAALAVLSLVVGAALAIVQTDVKRMMAYSSISHAGFMLVGLQAGTSEGIASTLFYLLAYSFMVLGSFTVIALVGREGDSHHHIDSYKGLARRRPGVAFAFTVFLLAQAGVPATAGFLAKFSVITAAVDAKSYALALTAMLSAVLAAFLYLRVVLAMYASPDESADDGRDASLKPPALVGIALAATLAVTVVIGLVPGPALDLARHATLLH